MEDLKHKDGGAAPKSIETDYEKHSDNPGPARPAVTEKDENGGGLALRWVIPLAIILLMIVWFFWPK
ncbi:hypothetical protein [Pedobacter sp. MW01-1-1]|uniref:hypothetical protein n=1 Tax=Pedobacter sp. MW01-1-1 TaxID=3383027 RepID=UPI003FF013CE